MKELYLQALGLYEILRTIGYTPEEIFFVFRPTGLWVEVRHAGRIFYASIGPLPDTHSEQAAREECVRLTHELQKPGGGYYDDKIIKPYVNRAKRHTMELLMALSKKGVFPL